MLGNTAGEQPVRDECAPERSLANGKGHTSGSDSNGVASFPLFTVLSASDILEITSSVTLF